MKTGPQFKVSYGRLVKPELNHSTSGLQSEGFIHYITAVPLFKQLMLFIFFFIISFFQGAFSVINDIFHPHNDINWASSRENLSSEDCEQQRRRPACPSAQSDQPLCYSLFGKHHLLACYKRKFIFLASLCS